MHNIDHHIQDLATPAIAAVPATSDLQPTKLTVANFLEQQIALSGISQVDIARALGYAKPNVISMIKTGATALPINKVPALAKALNLDAFHLLQLAMREYQPQAWAVIESVIERTGMLGEGEMAIVELMRDSIGNAPPPNVAIAAVRQAVAGGFEVAASTEAAMTRTALEAYDAKPSNAKNQ